MKAFLLSRLWPVVAGLVVASVIMMAFEYINSMFFPLPADLDIYDTAAVQAFTATLPFSAYILVLMGWIAGAFAAGYTTTHLAGVHTKHLALVVGGILTVLGIINNILIGHTWIFNVVGLPMFLIFTYIGYRTLLHMHETRASVPVQS